MSTAAAPACWATMRFRRQWGAGCVLFLSDALALELSLLLGIVIRLALRPWAPIEIGPQQYQGVVLGILLVPLSYALAGLYPGYGMNPAERLRNRFQATLLAFGLLIGWDYLVQSRQWSRGILLITLLFALLLPPLAESLAKRMLRRIGRYGMPVVIVGGGALAASIVRRLLSRPDLGWIPAGVFSDADQAQAEWDNVPVLGSLESACSFCGPVSTAIIALPYPSSKELAELVNRLPFPQIILVPDLPGLQSLWTVSRDLGGLLGLEMKRNLLLPSNRRLKQWLDSLLSVPLALLSLPLVAVFGLWIKLASRGPVFYRQLREGEGGRHIQVWKLRTMACDADDSLQAYLRANPEQREFWERHFKLPRDPRVIRGVGTLLRRFSLDELPQLWNVLRGEMSLVGPRPFPDYHLSSFSREFQQLRRSVPPGLTGLWQVSERSDASLQVQEALDTYYIRNWSVWLDLYILARTVIAVIRPRGAY